VPSGDDGRRPLDRWAEEEADRALVRSAKVVAASAPGLFADGVPLLPVAEPWIPSGPGPRGICVGRAYRVEAGWAWSGCLALPRVPDRDVLLRRLHLELWRERRFERRASLEDMLRARPEVLYRAACEGSVE
jgi:hypothetical protein